MNKIKNLGIWMDHSSAHLIAFTNVPGKIQIITSLFNFTEKEKSLNKSESLMHNKENHEQATYFLQIAAAIRDYDNVLIFGPTDAKHELYNLLKDDHLFSKINIEVKPADKMTEVQQQHFIKEYFTKHLIPKHI